MDCPDFLSRHCLLGMHINVLLIIFSVNFHGFAYFLATMKLFLGNISDRHWVFRE